MAEESTRRLLKLFGVAVTEFEDQTRSILERLEALGPPSSSQGQVVDLAEAWLRASGEVLSRWQEVNQLLVETQAKGQAELARVLAQWRRSPES
jgi:hypothetical protein